MLRYLEYCYFSIKHHCTTVKAFFIAILLILPSHNILSQNIPEQIYAGMKWRSIGPYRAGWATMAEGIPDSLNVYYFGSAGGGIWKTNDAGRTWNPLMQHENSSSVGALAIAPSNPNIIYVGAGQVAYRYDIMSGDGVYKSEDGGKTWKNIGLKKTQQIGRILVDPKNPNRVLVAALGHLFEPNSERGIFLTIDGGKTWKKVVFVNDSTGAVDLASDPQNPSVIYAAFWQMQMRPWLDYYIPQRGNGSGIFKSDDGGKTWKRLTGNGLPSGKLGRIGLGVAPGSKGQIVYATIDAEGNERGLYRSDDSGKTWKQINKDGSLANSYFSRVTIDPKNPGIVYIMDRSIQKSTDGGKTFTYFKGSPGGDDYHFLWINPKDPNYMITASDQGCVVTVNGGETWSSWYNQPTGQFYHIAADDQFPYKVYSGQQDNGTVGISSRGPYGVISIRDWHPVGGEERDYEVPKPGNPDIVFGTGLGGTVTRFDNITRQVAEISPWPQSSYAAPPGKVKYHYTWIDPLEFSPLGSHPMFFGAQVLFKSTNDGDNWEIISPNLSGKKEGAKDFDNPTWKQAYEAGYGVIFSIAPSPIDSNTIWIGMDNGLIHLTKDGGKTWKNVTPPQIPEWSRIDAIAPSPFSIKEVYAAVNTHRINKFSPMIVKTTDEGKTWQTIIKGLPDNQYVGVVRADLVKKGLLFAGTNRSVYVSFDDGNNWQPLTLNFPTASVSDLLVHDNDLVAGTNGRGIWILDDISPLRQISNEIAGKNEYLFKPNDAWRMRANENKDTPWPPSTPLGQNPPTGSIIDYWLNTDASTPVKLTIKDDNGNVINTFASDINADTINAYRYFLEDWVGKPEQVSNKKGMHRFVWDLRYPRPKSLRYGYSIAAVWDEGTPVHPEGALILPGNYTVTLSVNGKEFTQPLKVKLDPRVHVKENALEKQLKFSQEITKNLNESVTIYKKIQKILKEKKGNLSKADSDSLSVILSKRNPSLSSVAGIFAGLITKVQSADAAPTQGQMELFDLTKKQFDGLMMRLKKIKRLKD